MGDASQPPRQSSPLSRPRNRSGNQSLVANTNANANPPSHGSARKGPSNSKRTASEGTRRSEPQKTSLSSSSSASTSVSSLQQGGNAAVRETRHRELEILRDLDSWHDLAAPGLIAPLSVYNRSVTHAPHVLEGVRQRRCEAQVEVQQIAVIRQHLQQLPFRGPATSTDPPRSADDCARCQKSLWSESIERKVDPVRGQVEVVRRTKDCVNEFGLSFHRACFLCFGCDARLEVPNKPGSFSFSKDEEQKAAFCLTCYALMNGKRCTLCHKSIRQTSYRKQDGTVYCVDCSKASREPCVICGQAVPDQFLRVFHWKEAFCPLHKAEGYLICDSCERPESNVEAGKLQIETFDHQRHSCRDCRMGAVTNKEGLEIVAQCVLKFLDHCGMTFPAKIEYLPASLEVMAMLKQSVDSEDISRGICLSQASTYYQYTGNGSHSPSSFLPPISSNRSSNSQGATGMNAKSERKVEAIVVLYGYNAIQTSSTIAHELTHAWLTYHSKLAFGVIPTKVEEGLAQLTSYLWLLHLRRLLERFCPPTEGKTATPRPISSVKDPQTQHMLQLFFPAGLVPNYLTFLDYLIEKHFTHTDPNYGAGFLEAKKVYDIWLTANESAARTCLVRLCRSVAEKGRF